MYELSEIMRQKDDKTYAELLSRMREGNHSRNDFETLETRMIEENSTNYPFDALHMFATNAEVNTFNETVYNRTCTEKVVIVAKSAVVGDVTSTLKLKTMENLNNAEKYKKHTYTGGLMTELNLAIDLHYDCTINLDVDDGLTNGATCLLKKIEYKEGFSQPAILWVHFVEPGVGKVCRQKYRNLYSRSVQRSWTPIFAVSRTFIVSRALVSRQQFPLCPSSARTIHKCQGQTLHKAVVKMGDRKLAHSHYTALRPVTSINNLHFLRLNEQKISVSQSVKEEMHDLRVNRQVILCYTPVYALSACKHRIIFHNIRSLHAHFEDILHNSNYIAADIIAFAETRLIQNDRNDDYKIHVIRNDQQPLQNRRPPHGLALYIRSSYAVSAMHHYSSKQLEYSFVQLACNSKQTIQILVLHKANKCPLDMFRLHMNDMKQLICNSIPFLLIGDFNIDISSPQNKSLLLEIGTVFEARQLVTESTTVYNTTIDLAFSDSTLVHAVTIESLFSDHKLIAIEL